MSSINADSAACCKVAIYAAVARPCLLIYSCHAGSVEQALLATLAEKAPGVDPEEQLAKLTAEGRYQRDVWY